MKYFRNFLATWALIVLTVFVVYELISALEAIILNANVAYEIATEWYVVVISMILALIINLFANIVIRRKRR